MKIVPREDVSDELLQKAVALVQKAVSGNGLRGLQVALHDFKGEVLHFEAWEVFKLDPQVSERRAAGKQPGDVAGSEADMRQKIQALLSAISEDESVKKNTIELLRKREDKGFGLKNEPIALDSFSRGYVVHSVCSHCGGRKQLPCSACGADGRARCHRCRGGMKEECPRCNGAGTVDIGNGRRQCGNCYATGKVNCRTCRGKGTLPCKVCKADGLVPCKNCNASGWHSLVARVEVRAKPSFRVDDYRYPYTQEERDKNERTELPPEIRPLVEKFGPAMVTAPHAAIATIEDAGELAAQDQKTRSDEFRIPYHVPLPWGTISFRLKDQIITGRLFGIRPLLLQMPPFLEPLLGAPLRMLEEASRTKRGALETLRQAARTRAVADAVRASALNPHKKALEILQKSYPIGFAQKTLEAMAVQADAALKNITGPARLTGMLLGVFCALGFNLLWFAGPLRGLAATSLPPGPLPSFALDALLAAAEIAIIHGLIQATATKTLRQALGTLLSAGELRKVIPKAGTAGLTGALIALLSMPAIALAAWFFLGKALPVWMTAIGG